MHAFYSSLRIALDCCQLEGAFSSSDGDHCRDHCAEPRAVDELEIGKIEDNIEDLVFKQTKNGLFEDRDVGSSGKRAFQAQDADLAATLLLDSLVVWSLPDSSSRSLAMRLILT